jgi:hypothetical protein
MQAKGKVRMKGRTGIFLGVAMLLLVCGSGLALGQVNSGNASPSANASAGTGNASAGSNFGTPGVENVYTEYDGNIEERTLGYPCWIHLIAGDTIEVSAHTAQPADFISGNLGYFTQKGTDSGITDPLVQNILGGRPEVYQEESYHNATDYYLKKQLDRNCFVLDIKDSATQYRSAVRGHLKVVIHSKFSEAEHQQDFDARVKSMKSSNELMTNKLNNPSSFGY